MPNLELKDIIKFVKPAPIDEQEAKKQKKDGKRKKVKSDVEVTKVDSAAAQVNDMKLDN